MGAAQVTIICVSDGVMAVDRMMSADGVIVGTIQKWVKVRKRHGGGYIAGTGNCSVAYSRMRDFAKNGADIGDSDQSYIHLRGDKSVWVCQKGGWIPMAAPYVTEGSGMFMGMAAMMAGAGPRRAAEIVCDLMPSQCGGGIDVLTVNP
jgi:hypothetical protein